MSADFKEERKRWKDRRQARPQSRDRILTNKQCLVMKMLIAA